MIEPLFIFDEDDVDYRTPGGALPSKDTLRLRVKLLRGSAVRARVFLYKDGSECAAAEAQLDFAGASGSYDVYSFEYTFDAPGLFWYYFQIDLQGGGQASIPPYAGGAYQVTVYDAESKTCGWIHGGVIYHIFVDRFSRGGELRLRPGSVFRADWGGCPSYLPDEEGIVRNNDFFGGDIYGVIDKLPYFEKLGITCLYLSPVFEAASNHKYDTGDFMRVDPAFGGSEALERLCREAGERGIKVILDGVFNHVGIDSRYFNRYGRYDTPGAFQGRQSQYYDWFNFHGDGKYDAWWGIELLPAVNKSSESYREFICGGDGVIAHWTKKGVSGWRLDVVDELPDAFLDPLCTAIKRENSDALIVGEVWEDASNKIAYSVRRRYFLGGQLDSVTNYPLKDAIIDFSINGNAWRLASVVASLCRNYPEAVLHSLMNILGTHDTARILTVLGGAQLPSDRRDMERFRLDDAQLGLSKQRLLLAAVLQYTLPGVPCVFYGDEAGMTGCADPFNRRCYPWGYEDERLISRYAALGRMRREYPCFKDGAYRLVEARDGLFAFTRGEGDDRVLIAVNTTGGGRKINASGFNYDILNERYTDTLIVIGGEAAIFSLRKG